MQKSWFEDYPRTSMKFISDAGLPEEASIIDVGGGGSKLVDALLDEGYVNITVLDICERAIENAKERLGKRAENINWIAADVFDLDIRKNYDCWHDKAVFHFVTEREKVDRYIQIMADKLKSPSHYHQHSLQ
jgi:2-polyprenyl-3-methyl-5-hydroxy-6-metoxy-1,4-benzoquinol methylase